MNSIQVWSRFFKIVQISVIASQKNAFLKNRTQKNLILKLLLLHRLFFFQQRTTPEKRISSLDRSNLYGVSFVSTRHREKKKNPKNAKKVPMLCELKFFFLFFFQAERFVELCALVLFVVHFFSFSWFSNFWNGRTKKKGNFFQLFTHWFNWFI